MIHERGFFFGSLQELSIPSDGIFPDRKQLQLI
jgi:hypothetical protein